MRKKTLIFIEDGSYTFDHRVQREAQALVEHGWDVTVVSPRYPEDPFFRKVSENLRCYHYRKPNAVGLLGHGIEHTVSLVLGSAFTAWVAVRHGFSVFHGCNPLDTSWLIALPY